MNILYKVFFLILLNNCIFANANEIDNLLEKINEAKSKIIKKELIEELKIKLAKVNKDDKEQADAIRKAKLKIPLKNFKEKK